MSFDGQMENLERQEKSIKERIRILQKQAKRIKAKKLELKAKQAKQDAAKMTEMDQWSQALSRQLAIDGA